MASSAAALEAEFDTDFGDLGTTWLELFCFESRLGLGICLRPWFFDWYSLGEEGAAKVDAPVVTAAAAASCWLAVATVVTGTPAAAMAARPAWYFQSESAMAWE